jgi:hypothetical protein
MSLIGTSRHFAARSNSVAFQVKRTYHAVPSSLQQSLPRVILENFSIPDVVPQRVHAFVARLIGKD